MYFVYSLCDPRRGNRPFYIGKGTRDRIESHFKETYQTTLNRRKWCKIAAIQRAGLEVTSVIIQNHLTSEEAYTLEAKLIKQYGRIGFEEGGILTNICEDNRPPSAKGRIVSEETRKKHSERQIGPLNHRYGKRWSEDEKEYRRQFNLENGIKPPDHTGRRRSDETKAKQRQAAINRIRTQEHRDNLSKAAKGKKRGPHSPETRSNISAAQQRTYQFTSPEGKVYIVKSSKLKEFCRSHKMAYGSMMAAVKEGRKYKGWIIARLEP